MLVDFSGDGDVHWGYGILTHGHIKMLRYRKSTLRAPAVLEAPLAA